MYPKYFKERFIVSLIVTATIIIYFLVKGMLLK